MPWSSHRYHQLRPGKLESIQRTRWRWNSESLPTGPEYRICQLSMYATARMTAAATTRRVAPRISLAARLTPDALVAGDLRRLRAGPSSRWRNRHAVDEPVRLLHGAELQEPLGFQLTHQLVVRVVRRHRDQPRVAFGEPALDQCVDYLFVVPILEAGRQVVERVIHLADQVFAIDAAIAREAVRDVRPVRRDGQRVTFVGLLVVPRAELKAGSQRRLPVRLGGTEDLSDRDPRELRDKKRCDQ